MPFPLTCKNDNTSVRYGYMQAPPAKTRPKRLKFKQTYDTRGEFLKGKGKKSQYGPQFMAKTKEISNRLGCNYKDLMAVFNSESGVDAYNGRKSNGAYGLICFLPKWYPNLDKIKKMTPIQQLDEVEKAIKKYKKMAGYNPNDQLSKEDLYSIIFLPTIAKKGVNVLCSKNNKDTKAYYEGNKGLDDNKDGKITKKELTKRIENKYVNDLSFYA